MSGNLCLCGCGGAAVIRGCTKTCYKRWQRNSFLPESGPLPPMSNADRGLRSGTARTPGSDPYDVQWLAGAPERRVRRAKRAAADLVRCVAADDAEGVRLLLHRVSDWHALAVVLAECAEPRRTALVCATLAAVAGERSPARISPAAVALRAVEGDSDEAA